MLECGVIKNILQFINCDIWRLRSSNLPKLKGLGVRALRTTIVSVKQFGSDRCGDMASALTYYSLLSIVPVFAMAFGFAKGFGMEKGLKEKLLENMEGQEEVIGRVISFAEAMLESTKGGLIAGIGILILFWTVIKVLGNIERAFNLIWGVKKHRPMGRKFADYLSLMLICPVLFILGSSITVFISSQVTQATESITILSSLGPVITLVLKLLPYMVFWGLLTYIYSFMPNTKVKLKSALIGGVVAGTVYQLVQWAYIHFQVGFLKQVLSMEASRHYPYF